MQDFVPGEPGEPIQLTLRIQRRHLALTLVNSSPRPVRYWRAENSWGWFAVSIELRAENEPLSHVVRRAQRDWTRNPPHFHTLAPGERDERELDLHDGWWDLPSGLEQLRDRVIEVRSAFHVAPSPETSKYGVFVGTVLSDVVQSKPPHSWLFDTEELP